MASRILSSACRTNIRVQCTMYTHTCTYTSTRTVEPNDSRGKYNGAKQPHHQSTVHHLPSHMYVWVCVWLAPTPDLGKGHDLSGRSRTIIRVQRDCSKISQKRGGYIFSGRYLLSGFYGTRTNGGPRNTTLAHIIGRFGDS